RVLSASVAQLFMAGVIPGLILASMLGATTFYRAYKNNYPRMEKASWSQAIVAFRDSIWGLLLIVIVLGGIYTGAFTPTEAAAMSAVYAFVISVWVYRDMKLKDVPRVLLASANMSAMILYIITNAVLFSFLMTSEQIPQAITSWITGAGIGWIEFLLFVNIILLLAGNVMEPSSIVLITAPILFPVAVRLGMNPVHLGILMTVNMEVGLCHPPVGLNLYVASGIARMGITELTIATFPWLVTMLIFLVLVTYIPEMSLWLPRLLGMMLNHTQVKPSQAGRYASRLLRCNLCPNFNLIRQHSSSLLGARNRHWRWPCGKQFLSARPCLPLPVLRLSMRNRAQMISSACSAGVQAPRTLRPSVMRASRRFMRGSSSRPSRKRTGRQWKAHYVISPSSAWSALPRAPALIARRIRSSSSTCVPS